jgi:hypothetical protein
MDSTTTPTTLSRRWRESFEGFDDDAHTSMIAKRKDAPMRDVTDISTKMNPQFSFAALCGSLANELGALHL